VTATTVAIGADTNGDAAFLQRVVMTPSSVGQHLVARPVSITVRAPATARIRLVDVPSYWPVIRVLATRDLKARYKQSALGPAWVVFQPLALLAAFTVGFRTVAHVHTSGVPYAVFALAGLAVWTYFQAVTMVGTGSIVNNYPLVRWTACPRLALPLATLVSSLPSFLVPGLAAVVAAAAAGYLWIGWLLLPLMCLWLSILVGGSAILLSALTVRARDVLSVVPFMLTVTLFLSPVAYGTTRLSPLLRALISLNPLTGLLEAWRWSLLGVSPSSAAVIISLVLTTVGALIAWRLFAVLEVRMADEI
jgi:lipopolysaccharide transport system permease protein